MVLEAAAAAAILLISASSVSRASTCCGLASEVNMEAEDETTGKLFKNDLDGDSALAGPISCSSAEARGCGASSSMTLATVVAAGDCDTEGSATEEEEED